MDKVQQNDKNSVEVALNNATEMQALLQRVRELLPPLVCATNAPDKGEQIVWEIEQTRKDIAKLEAKLRQ